MKHSVFWRVLYSTVHLGAVSGKWQVVVQVVVGRGKGSRVQGTPFPFLF
jgi:hypothetical protein